MNLSLLRILVVEDQAFQRRGLVRLLRNLGVADVIEAEDGNVALAMIRAADSSVDVILSDVDMPGMDGLELLRRVGQSGTGVSVILVSATDASLLTTVEAMAAAYGVNLLGVISKPASDFKLLDCLGRHAPCAGPSSTSLTRAPPSAARMQAALRGGEIVAFFQPKVRIATLQIVGFEALARWRPRTGTLVPPAGFLPAIKQHDLMTELFFAMLEQSMSFGGGLRSNGLDVAMSINVCANSLGEVGFADKVTADLSKAGFEPGQVILEITESATVINDELGAMLENLARLRLRGFGLSIDDYGIGYSSLQQLGRIPFTELKVDRSFVQNARRDHAGMVLLQSSLDIARKLKLVSVAEGVELKQEWDLLLRLGCDVVQGYIVAPPMPASAALEWINQWQLRIGCGDVNRIRFLE